MVWNLYGGVAQVSVSLSDELFTALMVLAVFAGRVSVFTRSVIFNPKLAGYDPEAGCRRVVPQK
jgi:hypothetical protein